MHRTLIKDLHDHIGKEVLLKGVVTVRRDHGKLIFLDVRDRSGAVQAVALPNHAEVQKIAGEVRSEWVLELTGIVNKRPEKMVNAEQENGDIEIEITGLKVLSRAAELPFDLDSGLNIDTYLDYLPLTLRTRRARAIFKVQAAIVHAYRSFLRNEGFVEFQPPKLVGGDAEGGAGVFRVEYFNDRDAFLATSPQLYKQIMVGMYERVFATTAVFRAEKHSTTRHINEYTSLDAEMGFIEDHHDVMSVETRLLRSVLDHIQKTCEKELKELGRELPALPEEIPHLKLREAQEIIFKETGEDVRQEPDLEPAHERFMSEYAKKTYQSDFLFITHYPVEKRPMYTYEDEDDPGYTKSFDLLCRGLEITTGGQRIHEYDKLIEGIKRKGLDPEQFSFYLQAFKYGMPPHGGWGMGLERLTARFLELDNVREATLFPRDINRIDTLLDQP